MQCFCYTYMCIHTYTYVCMCVCRFFSLLQEKKVSLLFSLLVFRPDTFSLSLLVYFPHPCFFLFVSFHFSLCSLLSSTSLVFSLNVPALLPGPGHWCDGPHENLHPDLYPFWCVGLVLPTPSFSHSGLFICDIHFGITHLVPHHCTHATIEVCRDSTP